MFQCAYCGEWLESANTKHTNADCEAYLLKHNEGGPFFEKLGGPKHLESLLTHEERSEP